MGGSLSHFAGANAGASDGHEEFHVAIHDAAILAIGLATEDHQADIALHLDIARADFAFKLALHPHTGADPAALTPPDRRSLPIQFPSGTMAWRIRASKAFIQHGFDGRIERAFGNAEIPCADRDRAGAVIAQDGLMLAECH